MSKIKMLKQVPVNYVGLKSELSQHIEQAQKLGYYVYRTPLLCGCKGGNIRHHSAIVFSEDWEMLYYVIRCKSCSSRKGGEL